MLSFLRSRPATPPSENEALSTLRASLSDSATPPTSPFLTDACLLRYLRARNLSPAKAQAMLLETLSWRASYRPHALLSTHLPQLRAEASSGKMFVLPACDRAGRAVIVMRPGLENSSDAEGNVRYLVYTLERAAMLSERAGGDGKFTVLVDYLAGKVSVKTCPSLAVMKETTGILQNHYPERLGGMFLYDAPGFLVGMLRLMRPFIDPVTREKLFFVKSSQAAEDANVQRMLDKQHLPREYGGTADMRFDAEEYFAADDNVYV